MYIVFREVNSPTRGIFMCAIEGYSRPFEGRMDKYENGNYIYEVEILEMQPDIGKYLDK